MGCRGPNDRQASQESSFVDGLNREVNLSTEVERVVTIAPGATEIIRVAGGMDFLKGVSNADRPESTSTDVARFSALPLDIEAVVALEPDLILASDQVNDPAHIQVFDALGIPIFYLPSSSWEGIQESIRLTGTMLGTQEQAAAAVDSLAAHRDALIERTAAADGRPTAIFLVSHITSYSFGQGSYVLDLMRWAGLDPLMAEFDTPAPVLDDEWVLLRDPDVILGSFGGDFTPEALLENHPTWRSLSAVRNDRIINVPYELILTPGPRNVEAAWHIAQAAHPTLFADFGEAGSGKDQNGPSQN